MNATKPPLRILAPVSEGGADEPTASPPLRNDLDDATSPGLPLVSIPDEPMPPPQKPSSSPPVVTAVVAPAPDDALSQDGEVNGQVLRRLREKKGLTIDELVEQTKIRKTHIVAIEEQDLENLPARVYLRGYLTQIARVLKVDRDRLAEGYLSFVERFRTK